MLLRLVTTEAQIHVTNDQSRVQNHSAIQTTIVKFIVEYTVVCLLPTIFIVDDLQFKYF